MNPPQQPYRQPSCPDADTRNRRLNNHRVITRLRNLARHKREHTLNNAERTARVTVVRRIVDHLIDHHPPALTKRETRLVYKLDTDIGIRLRLDDVAGENRRPLRCFERSSHPSS